jgi:hypothetical protein
MKPEDEKYKRVINLLRKSKPLPDSTADIEREVIRRISKTDRTGLIFSQAIDFLFGWIYIGWVRRSLIMASILLVMIFVYQQGIILKRIDTLSKQTVVSDRESALSPADEIEKLLTLYKNSGRIIAPKTITVSERQMKELLETVTGLQNKYKDLEKLIDEDPELKKLIERKLAEINRTKINL